MVAIDAFSSLATLGQAGADRKGIADNFDTFLTLLTTQLKNQNPLEPLESNEFMQQLVQFTEVEQTVKANQNLETLAQISAANALTGAVSFIGKTVTAGSTNATLSEEPAAWQFTLDESSPATTFTVRDSENRIVSTETRETPAGENLYVWQGDTNEGGTAPPGEYTLSIRADDGNGQQLQVSIGVSGTVEAVDMGGAEPVLVVNGRTVKLSEVTSVKTPTESGI